MARPQRLATLAALIALLLAPAAPGQVAAPPPAADPPRAPDAASNANANANSDADAIDRAADALPQPLTVRLFWENDAPFFRIDRDTDRYYTNGTGLALAWHPDFADRAARFLPFADAFGTPDRTGFGLTAGQLIFTPQDITRRELIPDDRPYAGYLYGGAYLQRMRNDTLDHFQLDLGFVGDSSFAQDMQEFVHELFDDTDPNGWNNQLADEFTVQFTYRRKWRFDLARFQPLGLPLDLQLIPEAAGMLGTVHRHLETGATLRLGYRLPDDFGPARLADVNTTPAANPHGWSAYAFLRGAGRLVEHNLFLEGNNFGKDSHAVPIRTLVGEAQLGLVASYAWARSAFELGWSTTYRTETFHGQKGGHSFGAWVLTFHHHF